MYLCRTQTEVTNGRSGSRARRVLSRFLLELPRGVRRSECRLVLVRPQVPDQALPVLLPVLLWSHRTVQAGVLARRASRLLEELQTLTRSKDRLGDILIRMRKITTPQLLDVLVEQKKSGRKLGQILLEAGLVKPEDIASALQTQGVNPLVDTHGAAYSVSPVWDQGDPAGVLQYVLTLAARKDASDVHLEPKEDHIAVRYRIDGFFFRLDPIPRRLLPGLVRTVLDTFHLTSESEKGVRGARTSTRLGDIDYDLVLQLIPTTFGPAITLKLINRDTFIRDFTSLGMELDDRVRLVEELRSGAGLFLVTSPTFNGSITTSYSLMSFLVRDQKDVLSLESPLHWRMEGVRQMEVPDGPHGPLFESTLREMLAVRPDALMLSAVPDHSTATLAAQLATSLVVVASTPAPTAAQGLVSFLELGIPSQLLAGSLSTVLCQRLVRRICRICRKPAAAPPPQTLAAHGIGPEEASTLHFFKGKGCPTCNTVGYRGRVAVFELLAATTEVRSGIIQGLSALELETLAQGAGMRRMRERCLDLLREGVTSFDEFARLRL